MYSYLLYVYKLKKSYLNTLPKLEKWPANVREQDICCITLQARAENLAANCTEKHVKFFSFPFKIITRKIIAIHICTYFLL